MTKTKLMVLACFLAAFAAGAAAGVAWTRHSMRPPHGSWIEHALDLTPQQREQMRAIWSSMMSVSPQQRREQRLALQKERDAAVRALLDDEQGAKYDEVMKTYAEKLAAMDEAARKAFEEATQRTKEILTESQRKKYEELLLQGPGRRRHRGPEGMGRPDWNDRPPEGGEKRD
ncbi:MAG: Spy/CpxP family protein refolding chaperone [Planctomycetota bacterium]